MTNVPIARKKINWTLLIMVSSVLNDRAKRCGPDGALRSEGDDCNVGMLARKSPLP